MPNEELGKIEEVALREVFEGESSDFTPWLEENIESLSRVIGIQVDEVEKESDVGSFSVDLIGREVNSEGIIVIENQLEKTDHDHLGKLLTYAAGKDAKYIVWVTKKLREEHRKTIEWLNENSGEDLSFFGIEVRAIKIGGSCPALEFDVVAEPNTWVREIRQSNERLSERKKAYLSFFIHLVSTYKESKPAWSVLTPRPRAWLAFGAGKTGFRFIWAFKGGNRLSVELYIDTGDGEENKMYFNEVKEKEEKISNRINDLSWEELPDSRASRIATYYQMPCSAQELDKEQQDEAIKWAIEKMVLFKQVFREIVESLE